MEDVYQKAIDAQREADSAYASASAAWAELQALRGSPRALDSIKDVAGLLMPLIKKFAPAIVGAGGLGAVISDPSLIGSVLKSITGLLGGS